MTTERKDHILEVRGKSYEMVRPDHDAVVILIAHQGEFLTMNQLVDLFDNKPTTIALRLGRIKSIIEGGKSWEEAEILRKEVVDRVVHFCYHDSAGVVVPKGRRKPDDSNN